MKSLKDEIKDSLEAFSQPMKQAVENLSHIGENISDTVLDKVDEIKSGSTDTQTGENQPKKKRGCLKTILQCGFVIIAILAFLRNGCSFNSKIERDEVSEETIQEQTIAADERETLYDMSIRICENNIDTLITQTPIDTDSLEDEYEFLLTCLASEYMFKSMANGHFTGDYETTQYDYIAEKCGEIATEMAEYIDVEVVDSMYTAISTEAYKSFDDTMFNYDSCLIGTAQSPDIDAMWLAYFDSLVEAQG